MNFIVSDDGGQKTVDLYNNIVLTDKKTLALSYLRNTKTLEESNNTYWDLSEGSELYVCKDTTAKRSMSLDSAIRKGYIHSPVIADPITLKKIRPCTFVGVIGTCAEFAL